MTRAITRVWCGVHALLVLALVVSWAGGANAQDETWQAGMSVYHSSGDYGTGSTTTITSLPLSIRRLFQNGDVTLIVPFLRVTSDCGVTLLSGVPNQTGGTCAETTITTKNGKEKSHLRPTTTTESGIGDVVLRARYYVVDEQGWVPTVAVTGKIKFPTANRSQGLGTGEFDEGLGLQVSKTLTEAWVSFVDLGYTNLGNPPGVTLRNQWNYDLGLGYYFTKTLLGSVYYEEWTAVISDRPNPRDLLVAMNYTASSTWRFNSSIARGLSDGAPDWAFTAGVNARF